jgi:hypothetical protein
MQEEERQAAEDIRLLNQQFRGILTLCDIYPILYVV